MELNKLTICRQEVIVVSDTESQTGEQNKKKKPKRKIECIRNVKLTKITVNRDVPNCYRERCRHELEYYHRQRAKHFKYCERKESSEQNKRMERKSPEKNQHCEEVKNDNSKIDTPRNLCTPISISSNDTYDTISSCSFNVQSSDSDELDDLIKITRQRMKNENFPLTKTGATSNYYDNVSSNDEVFNTSFHSLDTQVISKADSIPSPKSPGYYDEMNKNEHNNNNLEPICTNAMNSKDIAQTNVGNLADNEDNKNNMSPLYEISGKVFMEHYLNTSCI